MEQVPCLAICEDKRLTGVLLFHCDAEWNVLGCSAHDSVSKAKQHAEVIYRGLSGHWVDANVSEEVAEAYLDETFGDHRCKICGKRADQVEQLVETDAGFICDRCTV